MEFSLSHTLHLFNVFRENDGNEFDEDDMFSPPSFDEQIYYDESMPPIYDDYIDESGFWKSVNFRK